MIHAITETVKITATMMIVGAAGHFTIDENTHLPMGWVLGGFTTAVIAAFWAGRNYSKIGQSLASIESRLSRLEHKVEAQNERCLKHYETFSEDRKHNPTVVHSSSPGGMRHDEQTGGAAWER